jgi:acylphosphatase
MTVHLLISGFVQGVGYRQFVKKTAIGLGLVGWVKNTTDRRVEILAIGSRENLEELIGKCKGGPFLSKVNDVKADLFEKEDKFDKFSIIL